ncbi:MAG TPA: DUF6531 domain-containing protein [Blastocatellia bacterium]|nr:DUF6531 domain-containing protein [Blastocatellia bacterium]
MMPAAKHFDPVLGIDIHIVQPPGPVPPIPVPHPFIGFLFDPFDYVPILGATIMVNGVPRAIAGTNGRTVPGVHFPIGGTFVKPPANECEMFMGSSTVDFDGDAASYMALPALSCQDIGIAPPFRTNPKKKTKIKSLVLPTSVVLPIPTGPPVLIGGPPTISLMALGMRLGMFALGKGLKRLARSKLSRRLGAAFKKARQRMFGKMKPGFLKCALLRAEPINVVTGEVVVEQEDFQIPGRIPLRWTRRYVSSSERMGVCGYGWETPADARLVFEPDGSVVFYDGEPGAAIFESLPADGPVMELVDGAILSRSSEQLCVRTKAGLEYCFPIPRPGQPEVLIQTIRDLSGNWLQFERVGAQLISITESAGRALEFVSNQGLVDSIRLRRPDTPERHRLARYSYDQDRNLVTAYDALEAPYRFEYRDHRLIRHTDRRGLSFYYEYNSHTPDGRCVHTYGDGDLYNYRFRYYQDLRQTEITDSLGHVSFVDYDDDLFIVREIDPLGGVTQYEYDGVGRTTAVVDPGGHRTQYEYDARGNVTRITRPDGVPLATEFNEDDRAVAVTDPNGAVWRQDWNDRRLLARQTSPLGAVSQYEYDPTGQLTRFTDPLGAVTGFTRDRYGSLESVTDALGHTTRLTFDVLGNLTSRIDPLDHLFSYFYDAKSRLTRTVSPSGATVEYGYDSEDNLTFYRDENSRITRLEYTGLGELARRLQPDGTVVEYRYDTEERLIAVINQRREAFHLKRDPLGRIVEEIDYWGQSRRYEHDAAGHLKQIEDPLGRIIRYRTDSLGRLIARVLPDGSTETFGYDPAGNVTSTANRQIEVKRVFDADGRLIEEQQGAFKVVHTYDLNGNRVRRESSHGNTVVYGYDAVERVCRVQINEAVPLVIERNSLGYIEAETLAAGLSRRSRYSSDGFLTHQDVLGMNGPLVSLAYEYDPAGNLRSRTDSLRGEETFLYDPVGRVTEHLNPERKLKTYFHDPAGDLLTRRREEVGGPARVAEYDGVRCRFDAAGNLVEREIEKSGLTFEWDADNRLVKSVSNGVSTHYGYDAQGRRLFKETGGRRTHFYWDGDALLAEETRPHDQAAERAVCEFVYYPETFEPCALIDRGRSIYYYNNYQNGSPQSLLDVSGAIVWSAASTVLGGSERVERARIDNPLRLQNQYYDAETGLHYNRHRYFDPQTGQFVSPDPLGLIAGENLYQFAVNIHTWIDPLGLSCKKKISFTDWIKHKAKQGNNTHVYIGYKDGKAVYVGIAKNLDARALQHGDRFDKLVPLTTAPLNRGHARSIEQAIINNNPHFQNAINSISPSRTLYNDAVNWGSQWLQSNNLGPVFT